MKANDIHEKAIRSICIKNHPGEISFPDQPIRKIREPDNPVFVEKKKGNYFLRHPRKKNMGRELKIFFVALLLDAVCVSGEDVAASAAVNGMTVLVFRFKITGLGVEIACNRKSTK